jgi:hypothetical protein
MKSPEYVFEMLRAQGFLDASAADHSREHIER